VLDQPLIEDEIIEKKKYNTVEVDNYVIKTKNSFSDWVEDQKKINDTKFLKKELREKCENCRKNKNVTKTMLNRQGNNLLKTMCLDCMENSNEFE
jgi:DNA-directed RNA polymerase subunit M/transcription elongation factor TFIIS